MNVIVPRRRGSLFEQRINRTPSGRDEVICTESPFGSIPPSEDQLRIGPIQSLKNDGIAHAILTQDKLIFTNTSSLDKAYVVDFIYLKDVKDVNSTNKTVTNIPVDFSAASLLLITTHLDGHGSGRTYELLVDSEQTAYLWKENIRKSMDALSPQRSTARRIMVNAQITTRDFYQQTNVQFAFAVFIFFNFVSSVVEAELKVQDGSREQEIFLYLEWGFTIFFTIEILISLVSCADNLENFFFDRFKMFDLLVVVCSLLALLLESVPGLGVLRVMRAFRIIRLFGRLSSLRDIMKALMCSWMPVVNAMMIVFFTTAVYAILANQFFAEMAPFHFDTFSRAFFTMFTVITFDGWVDMVYTEMTLDDGTLHAGVVLFFISFIVLVVWTMMSVVVAIMLDNFTKEAEKADTPLEDHREQKCLDPLLSSLITFSNARDLKRRSNALFHAMDVEQQGKLSCLVFCDTLRKIQFKSESGVSGGLCMVSAAEFEMITRHGELCDECGDVGPAAFERILSDQLIEFVQETCSLELHRSSAAAGSWNAVTIVLASLKLTQLHDDNSRVGERLGRLEGLVEAIARKVAPEALEGSDKGQSTSEAAARAALKEGAATDGDKEAASKADPGSTSQEGAAGNGGSAAQAHEDKQQQQQQQPQANGGETAHGRRGSTSRRASLSRPAWEAHAEQLTGRRGLRGEGSHWTPTRQSLRVADTRRHEFTVDRPRGGTPAGEGPRQDGGPVLEYSRRTLGGGGGMAGGAGTGETQALLPPPAAAPTPRAASASPRAPTPPTPRAASTFAASRNESLPPIVDHGADFRGVSGGEGGAGERSGRGTPVRLHGGDRAPPPPSPPRKPSQSESAAKVVEQAGWAAVDSEGSGVVVGLVSPAFPGRLQPVDRTGRELAFRPVPGSPLASLPVEKSGKELAVRPLPGSPPGKSSVERASPVGSHGKGWAGSPLAGPGKGAAGGGREVPDVSLSWTGGSPMGGPGSPRRPSGPTGVGGGVGSPVVLHGRSSPVGAQGFGVPGRNSPRGQEATPYTDFDVDSEVLVHTQMVA